ncbi:MAG: DegT/DnrJ/EryC1/StrS family aminotransferase [Pseudomonadota bacterium]
MIQISKPFIGEEEKREVMRVLESGMLAQGKKVAELEELFCRICGTKYAVATTNGTTALHAALYALGIKPGDEVITTPFTFVATANPILMQGAKVVFSDVDGDTCNLDAAGVEGKINERTAAVLPVDLYGLPFDARINSVASKRKLLVLEDACQAIGAARDGKSCGSLGDAGAFSLYATKNVTCGEGGMITTDSEETCEKARRFRHHGQSEKTRYEYADIGHNYRMSDILAAIALGQLGRLEPLTGKRNENARRLGEGLEGLPGVALPSVPANARHAFHQYTVRISEKAKVGRDRFVEMMKAAGVGVGVYYPKPLHLHPHFARMGYRPGDFPVCEKLAAQVVSLPVHPHLSDDDVEKIITEARRILS